MSAFFRGQRVYALHVVALVAPGTRIPTLQALRVEAQPLDAWEDADLALMVEEGRRQADRQLADLERIRGRAQWLFSLGVAVATVLATVYAHHATSSWVSALRIASFVLLFWGVAGAAAILVGRADFQIILTALLSGVEPPVLRALAVSYSKILNTGEDTIATRLTVFRQAVLFSLLGAALGLLAFIIDHHA